MNANGNMLSVVGQHSSRCIQGGLNSNGGMPFRDYLKEGCSVSSDSFFHEGTIRFCVGNEGKGKGIIR
jgi:hypothetical protein